MRRKLPSLRARSPGRDVAAMLPLLILLAACGRPAVRDNQPADVDVSSPPAPTVPSDASPSPVAGPSTVQGYIAVPAGVGDAGNFFLYAGSTLTLTWESPPAGAARYDFVLAPFGSHESILIGSDLDASDGVSAQWQVPEQVQGSLRGAAIYSDGRVVYSLWSGEVYSGAAPPEGVCVLASGTIGALDVFAEASETSPAFAFLAPGEYAQVLERTASGWYRIDASTATDPLTGGPASGAGWVDGRRSVEFFGPCDTLPIGEPSPSSRPPA